MQDLLLMRHGQTEWNAAGRMQGRLNSPLTDQGRDQADHLRQLLGAYDLTGMAAYTSSSGRAVQTAGIALGWAHMPIRSDDRLMEIDIGDWSGRRFEDLKLERPDLFADPETQRLTWYDHAPGGEGFAGLEARCRAFLADLRGPAVIVTHGITLHMLRSLVLSGDAGQLDRHGPCRQGVIYRLRAGKCDVLEN